MQAFLLLAIILGVPLVWSAIGYAAIWLIPTRRTHTQLGVRKAWLRDAKGKRVTLTEALMKLDREQ